jgi:transposase
MTGHKDSLQIQRLEVVNTGRRRRWTLAEKLRIVEESFQGHRQVSATARIGDGASPRYLAVAVVFVAQDASRGVSSS